MNISRELVDAVWAKQNQRESDERELLRQAVAASETPLPEELAAAVVRNFITEMLDIMRGHPGYRDRMVRFHNWMTHELESDALVALRDYDALRKRKKHVDQRMFWNGLLGNWLINWKVPPNPHGHLDKYLTPEQLADVYSFPRNSKEQVDRVIHYMDREGAADDDIRKQAYELFQRSPPA
jgi:hypothetical protein